MHRKLGAIMGMGIEVTIDGAIICLDTIIKNYEYVVEVK
jgi:hypothetical protein